MTASITRLKREPRLRLVEQPIDVTMLLRADIAKRDWDRVMTDGDKQKPVDLPDRVRPWAWS